MAMLDRKLVRDFKRLWPQALAVSLVLACGVATLILSIGAYRSLLETRQAYYERHRFASVFASATRAPMVLERQIGEISGVLAAEARIVEPMLLDIVGMREPATGQVISLPDQGMSNLNRLYLRAGRLPEPGKRNEVVVSANFAESHGFKVGSTIVGTLAGHQVRLRITGLALSPEFIYAIGPGDLIPDHRRFAILWMRHKQLSGLTNLTDAFNSISLTLLPGALQQAVIDRLDHLLRPYGGTGAYGRDDHMSHAFLDSELTQLQGMARVIPPVFMLIAAYLVNMILSRLIALEREQIGLLKALGYGRRMVALHYIKLVLVIAAVGVAIGLASGIWLGRGLTELYGTFFNFPFLIFQRSLDMEFLAIAVSAAAALLGALKAVWSAAALPAATAMRPAAPPQYRRAGWFGTMLGNMVSQLTVMAVRHVVRWPVRAGLTALGTSLSVALLVTAMFTFGSIDFLIDTMYFRTDRQDATIGFARDLSPKAVLAAKQLPGVMAVEPFRSVAADLTHGARSRRLGIIGKPKHMRLSRILNLQLEPITLPANGIVLTERVAQHLDVRRGDIIHVRLLQEGWHEARVPVVDIVQSYMGLGAYMDIDALDRLSRTGPRRSGVYVELDDTQLGALFKKVKATPAAASVALRSVSLKKFRETMEQNIVIMMTVYIVLAVIIAFGVVYNSARIQLSERARELASLRVLGFTRGEVSSVLVVELAIIVLVAQPLGWLIGYGFSWAVVAGFQNDLMRIPFVVEPNAFGWSSVIVLTAATVSSLVVLLRVRRLDMIRVLKTKE